MAALDNVHPVQFAHTELKGGWSQVTATHGGDDVGWLRQHPSGVISSLGVAASYQRQGVATGMYNEAAKHGPITHSKIRTKAGEGFAKSVGGPIEDLRPEGYMADMEPPPLVTSPRVPRTNP
jgi:hypothetical protein